MFSSASTCHFRLIVHVDSQTSHAHVFSAKYSDWSVSCGVEEYLLRGDVLVSAEIIANFTDNEQIKNFFH